MGYYDIRQIPLFLAANDKRPVHLIYPFVGKPWPINHCQHLSGLPPPGVGNYGFAPHHYDNMSLDNYRRRWEGLQPFTLDNARVFRQLPTTVVRFAAVHTR